MAVRPVNVGVKAIELYFPSQVCSKPIEIGCITFTIYRVLLLTFYSASIRQSLKSSMESVRESIQLGLGKPK